MTNGLVECNHCKQKLEDGGKGNTQRTVETVTAKVWLEQSRKGAQFFHVWIVQKGASIIAAGAPVV